MALSEIKDELGDVAESHGWFLQGIDLYDLATTEQRLKPEEEYTVFVRKMPNLPTQSRVSMNGSRILSQAGLFSIPCPRCGSRHEIRSDTGVRSGL